MIYDNEAWDDPTLEKWATIHDYAEPVLRTTVPDSTPHETFEQRLERDRKQIDMKGVAA